MVNFAQAVNDALEAAAKACEDQQQVFLSTQYATGQPLSSFQERFACGRCAEAIRALKTPAILSEIERLSA